MKKTILKGAAMLLGGVLLGTLLMIAAYAIPSETVWENVRVSAQTLANEGLRYEAIGGYHASRLDDFTDAIMIGNAVLTTEDPVESAMTARHFTGGETIGTLMRYLDGEDVPTDSYARYWHGYLAALKPLLMVMNLNSIRVLNMYAQLALVLWTAALMVRRGLSRHVLALFAAGFLLYTVFNAVFLPTFYRNGYKVGAAFIKALIPVTLVMVVCEALPHLPGWGWLDDLDGATQLRLLPVLAVSAAVYAASMLLSFRRAAALYEKVDL